MVENLSIKKWRDLICRNDGVRKRRNFQGHELFGFDQRPEEAKLLVTDPIDEHHVFGLAERAVFFTMLDDLRGGLFTDVRNFCELFFRGGVDI